jgi:hypothetical protein
MTFLDEISIIFVNSIILMESVMLNYMLRWRRKRINGKGGWERLLMLPRRSRMHGNSGTGCALIDIMESRPLIALKKAANDTYCQIIQVCRLQLSWYHHDGVLLEESRRYVSQGFSDSQVSRNSPTIVLPLSYPLNRSTSNNFSTTQANSTISPSTSKTTDPQEK